MILDPNLMKKYVWLPLILLCLCSVASGRLPEKKDIIEKMTLVNDHFMSEWPNPGDSIHIKGHRPSNIWTRAVYMEGLLALNEVDSQKRYVDYAIDWAVANLWGFRGGAHTRNADNQCCAQVYIDLYRMHGNKQVLGHTERMVNNIVNSTQRDDWWWVDALQMAMPVYAKMGVEKRDIRYFRTMMELYKHTRDHISHMGLYNPVEGLWWRDADFLPPYKEPNGEFCYWSRGNGWAMAALVRTLEEISKTTDLFPPDGATEISEIRQWLEQDFVAMAFAVKACQREDGFWNCSLKDESHYGGKETTGTSLFVYGIAYGIRKGLLSPVAFGPVVEKAWKGLSTEAVHPDGFLGYVQGTGKEPKDGQPVTYDSHPDFEDFGVGCFLLAGSEMAKLSMLD